MWQCMLGTWANSHDWTYEHVCIFESLQLEGLNVGDSLKTYMGTPQLLMDFLTTKLPVSLLDLVLPKGWVYHVPLCIAPNPITVPSRHQKLKGRSVKGIYLYFRKYLSVLKRESRRNYFWSSHTNRHLFGFISGRVYFLLIFKSSYSRLLSPVYSLCYW